MAAYWLVSLTSVCCQEPGGGDQLALCGRTAGKGLVCVVRNLEEEISSLSVAGPRGKG